MDTQNTVLYKLVISVVIFSSLAFSHTLQAQEKVKAAAVRAVDLNIHYKYNPTQVETEQLLSPKPTLKKSLSKVGNVTEEKNTSSSQQKALVPYQRTVSTGLSF